MALSFKDPETEALARKAAELTGESLTQSVKGALQDRLEREQILRGYRPIDRAAVDAVIAEVAALPVYDNRGGEDLMGYDDNGLPT